MANVNGFGGAWNSVNDYSYLFNSMSGSNKNAATNNILGIDLAEYSSITKGSYNKLMKAYYDKYGDKDPISKEASEMNEKLQTTLKGKTDSLYKAADLLTDKGKDSLFQKVEVKNDETGAVTKEYDVDKIYEAVDSFVKAYNGVIESSVDSSDKAVLRKAVSMVNATATNGSLLDSVGIKVGEDNKLTVDEETFKKADMSTVQSLFNGSDSYAGKIQSAASNMYVRIGNALSDNNTYTASGTMGNYTTGNILDSFL